jgi:hypothetical protein
MPDPENSLDSSEPAPELKDVADFLAKVEGKASEVDAEQVADYVSDVVVALRSNRFVQKLIQKWDGLSYEEQRLAAQADQEVIGRLFSIPNVVPFSPGRIKEVKSNFIKSMLYYGVIDFRHEGTPDEHEALIKQLHLNDQTYAKWVSLLMKGVGVFAPQARPLVAIIDQLERLLAMSGDFSTEIRSAVHDKMVRIVDAANDGPYAVAS